MQLAVGIGGIGMEYILDTIVLFIALAIKLALKWMV